MSSKAYIEAHKQMTDEQRNAMWELWMSGTNRDGAVWVRYKDVEETVAELLGAKEVEDEESKDSL